MTFIVSLVSLLIERFFDWSHLRRWGWFQNYSRKIMSYAPAATSYLALAIVVVPLLLAILIVQFILQGWLYGLLSLIFQVFVVLFCFGSQNLWADSFGAITGLTQGSSDKLKTAFGITKEGDVNASHRLLLDNIFVQANNRVFAVVFWYVVLGPVGAVLYRTVALSANDSALTQSARTVEQILNWLPARILTFLFALGGSFSHVLTIWRKHPNFTLEGTEAFLVECGMAAIAKEDQTTFPIDGSVERSAVGMLDRAFVISLVLILIVSLLS